MDLYTNPQRNNFKLNSAPPINIHNIAYIPKLKRNVDLNFPKRNDIRIEGPKSRLYGILSEDEVTNKLLKEQGIKVYLADKTIQNIITSKVPKMIEIVDPDGTIRYEIVKDKFGNPVMIDSTVNISTLASLLANPNVSLQNLINKGTKDIQTTIAFLQSIVEDTQYLSNITIKKLDQIKTLSNNLGLGSGRPIQKRYIGTKELFSKDYKYAGAIFLYLLANSESRGLPLNRQVWNTAGKPVWIDSVRKNHKDKDTVIDLDTSRLFDNEEQFLKYESSEDSKKNKIDIDKTQKAIVLMTNLLDSEKISGLVDSDIVNNDSKKYVKSPETIDITAELKKIKRKIIDKIPIDTKIEKHISDYIDTLIIRKLDNIYENRYFHINEKEEEKKEELKEEIKLPEEIKIPVEEEKKEELKINEKLKNEIVTLIDSYIYSSEPYIKFSDAKGDEKAQDEIKTNYSTNILQSKNIKEFRNMNADLVDNYGKDKVNEAFKYYAPQEVEKLFKIGSGNKKTKSINKMSIIDIKRRNARLKAKNELHSRDIKPFSNWSQL